MGDRSYQAPETKRTRVIVIGAVITSLILLYLFHLFSMQVIDNLRYKEEAKRLSQKTQPIPAKRGEIFDRARDVPLVLNVDSFQVNFNPAEVEPSQIPSVLSRLSPLLRIPFEELDKKVPPTLYSSYQPIELKKGVDYPIVTTIAERLADFPGVTWENNPTRSYVDTGSLSHVIGYVGNITQEELQVLYNKGYGFRSVVGKNGIEKRFDPILRGKEGTRFRTVDVNGKNIESINQAVLPPELGKNIVLTIDRRIQRLAEKALGPRNGSVIVMQPSTGEILAMVSYPFYDPNQFYTENAAKEFLRLQTDPTYPFLNRAIQSSYPPGSTFKVIMTTAILSEKVLDPKKVFLCVGSLEVGDRIFKDNVLSGHGPVNLARALALSCNVYYYTAGLDYLGVDRIDDYSNKYGLGQTSGIDLPGEISGIVPTPKWKEKNLNYPWLGGDTVNMSIGQGYLQVTPIQMANVVAMVSNSGKVYRPHLVKAIVDPISGKTEETTPELLYEMDYPKELWSEVQNDMRGVISEGTAAVVVTTKSVKIAGKTGTAEDGTKGSSNHSWFIAFAPWDNPDPDKRIAVVVQVEKTNEWEWWAPKAANLIFHGIFANQTYEEVIKDLHPWYMKLNEQ